MDNPFIPLVDLKAQYATLAPEMQSAVQAVMERGDFILGSDVSAFEQAFADYCGVPHAVGCANGTDALQLAVQALGIGPGDEVILPAMTFVATALGVTLAGATPVLVDVLADTALIDPEKIEAAITPRTRAILPVHLYGQCADMDAIQDIARRRALKVIEDAAQAHGAYLGEADAKGRRAGAMGDIGCFSFYPGKNLGCYGDGGAATTADEELAERLRMLRNLGSPRKFHHDEPAPNSRLDTIQAAVLRVKLPHLDGWNQRRRAHAEEYSRQIQSIDGIDPTSYAKGCVYHLYVIRAQGRDETLQALNSAGIGAGIHYPFAVHELGAYRELGDGPGSFPVAEDWARRCLSLPIYAELPADAPARAAEVLRKVSS